MNSATAESPSTQLWFDVRDPATGAVVGRYPLHTEADVDAAVARARDAGTWWAALGFAERARRLDRWRAELTRGRDDLARTMRQEMGKPLSDAKLEIAMALEHLKWAARNAERVLGPRSVNASLLTINQSCRVEYRPFGVVGVIGPWNYPVFTPLGCVPNPECSCPRLWSTPATPNSSVRTPRPSRNAGPRPARCVTYRSGRTRCTSSRPCRS
ncbi:aldehyde dehydrogenase family protein [Nocardia jiangxiensis]|uniref:Aldehyde dehydrogenase family protein n=1 Tax=Nocardia jiangxiensis TaxID=282685 RepID=A0ABW6S830_9NOCA